MMPELTDLADAVLAAPPEARCRALDRALAAARYRRWRRRCQPALALLAVAATTFLIWPRATTPSPEPVAGHRTASVTIVSTHPAPPGTVLATQPGSATVVASDPGAFELVRTLPRPELADRLTDQQLLELVAGHPVALVREESGARLVFAFGQREPAATAPQRSRF